jgi:hypothetical protein
MTDYELWAARHPQAAAELHQLMGAIPWPANDQTEGKSEAHSQQRVRLNVAKQGAMSWRNNVGATPAKILTTCPKCGLRHEIKQSPTRYGLANDSQKLNAVMKSSDLILAIPRLITQPMVGMTIAQFGAVECKRPGWKYRGDEHELGQLAWLELVAKLGGFATFSTGEVVL